MDQALTVIEPFKLPDLRRPGQMPSLPGWLVTQLGAASSNLQMDPKTRKFNDVLTLPSDRMPSEAQRAAATAHCQQLRALCQRTPEKGDDWAKATMEVLTRMFLSLPSRKESAASADVKMDSYLEALDDVPSWAVAEAMRGWYRGTHSDEYDFSWAPAPAVLRKLSVAESLKFEFRAREIEKVMTIQPFDPKAEEHCASMRKRLKEAMPWMTIGEARS